MKKLKLPKKFCWRIEQTESGFSAYEVKLPLFTTAAEMAELLNHCYEAEALYFDKEESELATIQHQFIWDWRSFFNHYRILNARLFAKRVGINPALLSQYMSGNKVPSWRQQQKLVAGVKKIGEELSQFDFL